MKRKAPPKVHFDMAVRVFLCPLLRYRGKGPMVHGMSCIADRTIWIDPRTREPGPTLVHELYHIQHPDWSEEVILRAEEMWTEYAPWREKAAALRLFGKAKVAEPGQYPHVNH